MKKLAKFSALFLIGFCALFVFGCSSDSDSGGPGPGPLGSDPALGDTVELDAGDDIQVYEGGDVESTDSLSFNKYRDSGSDDAVSITLSSWGSVTVASGKLSLDLDVPDDGDMSLFTDFFPPTGITVTPNTAKGINIMRFENSDGTKKLSYRRGDSNQVVFMYAAEDVTVTGTSSEEKMTFNLSLKEGWNTVLVNDNGAVTTVTTGAPDAGYVWLIY
jgi:hypothetical protein